MTISEHYWIKGNFKCLMKTEFINTVEDSTLFTIILLFLKVLEYLALEGD